MRTRLTRTRRRPRGVWWAIVFLMLSMALYIRVSVPALRGMQEKAEKKAETGERVTEEICIEPLTLYMVSFGGYDVMNAAKVEAARYVPRGAAGYVLRREKLYVIGAGYQAREDAEKACVSLAAGEGLACAVMEAYSPQVVMRMTAGSRQVSAFAEGEAVFRESAQMMGALAFSLDRGEATAAQAKEAVKTQMAKVCAAEEELLLQAAGTENGIFQGLSALLAQMREQMERMTEEEKAMELSSRMKYCHIDMTVREIEMLNALLR